MYLPVAFAVDEGEAGPLLQALLGAVPATLVTQGNGTMCSTVLPLTWTAAEAGPGTLRGHVAKANPLARQAHSGEALVVVVGAQGYISPSWYPSKRDHGRVVPTWDYVAVEAAGPLVLHTDPSWLRSRVEELTERFEGSRSEPWAVTDAPEEFVNAQLGAIVGVEIELTRIQAKAKLSQNRPAADIAGVAAGLRADGTDAARRLADLVERASPGPRPATGPSVGSGG